MSLRFGDVVGGLASSLHPLLGFHEGPCLDAGDAGNASARKGRIGLHEMRTWCLVYSTTQPRLLQKFRTCQHTKSPPIPLSGVSDPELGAKIIPSKQHVEIFDGSD